MVCPFRRKQAKELPLYGSSGFKLFWESKFDQAMVAFLDCTVAEGAVWAVTVWGWGWGFGVRGWWNVSLCGVGGMLIFYFIHIPIC